jgi:hypothetical protein
MEYWDKYKRLLVKGSLEPLKDLKGPSRILPTPGG